MGMLVSVVIPCHGGVEDTVACLETLRAQDPWDGVDLEILVVDNASPDDTAVRCAEVPGVRVLQQATNLGFAGGVNAGLRIARGDVLVVLNNDTLAAPNLLRRLVTPLLGDARIGITAPVSNHVKGHARLDIGDLGVPDGERRQLEATLCEHHPGLLQDVETLAGLCLAMPRRVYDRLGGFDDRFGLGNYEDDDLCLRARLLGYRLVIVRDAFLHHHGNRTFNALGVDYRATLAARKRTFHDKWRHDPAGAAALARSEGHYATAADSAAAGLACHPAWPDGHFILARARYDERNWAAAIRHFELYLQKCPTHTDAWILLAFGQMHLHGEAAGVACLGTAMARCYFSTQATLDVLQFYGAWLLGAGRPDEAAARFAEALELAPDSTHFQNLRGKALYDAGAMVPASRCFAAAYEGGEPRGLLGLGASLWHAGAWREGLAAMARAVTELPDEPEPRHNLDHALATLESQGTDVARLRRTLLAGTED